MSSAYHTPVRKLASSDLGPLNQWHDITNALFPIFSFGVLIALTLLAGYVRLFVSPFGHKITSGGHKRLPEVPSPCKLLIEVVPSLSIPKETMVSPSPPMKSSIPYTHQLKLHQGTFRTVAVDIFHSMLLVLRNTKWKIANDNHDPFVRKEQLPCLSYLPEDEVASSWDQLLTDIFPNAGHQRRRVQGNAIGRNIMLASSVPNMLIALEHAKVFHLQTLSHFGVNRMSHPTLFPFDNDPNVEHPGQAGTSHSHLKLGVVVEPEHLLITWSAALSGSYLPAVAEVAHILRQQDRYPTFGEFIGFHVAYHLLRQGCTLSTQQEARFLGTIGFRQDAQTYVSLTDPGEGHLFGTTRKTRWMKGSIVHVEHLERPENLPRSAIESYRIPSILDFARTRIHTGSAAPTTYFVGRALRDSASDYFDHDFIKIVNTTSAAATAAFQLGAAECKVAMDGLKTGQMVAYMRALGAHTLRSHRQYFSAAFNLNTPLVDDLGQGEPMVLHEQLDIGHRAIELAALGGFNKVTWDGAADTYPSRCIMDQLGFQKGLELVHRAHSAGLVTYMSAGFKFHNIKDAVVTGVDGIGIGGAQILRYMDGISRMHGPYTEENIDRIIKERDTAERSIRGRGSFLLARLDQMHFEGSIVTSEEVLRKPLYDALHSADEERIRYFISDKTALGVYAIPVDSEQPWLGRARRILRKPEPLLRRGASKLVRGDAVWDSFVRSLEILVRDEDEDGLYAYSLSGSWKNMRSGYREVMSETSPVAGELSLGLKVTPPFT